MSNEEQFAMVGRLNFERAEARRQCSLIEHQIKAYPEKLSQLCADLSRMDDASRSKQASSIIEGLINSGGLEVLRRLLSDHQMAHEKIMDIGQTLRNAGAE